MIALVLPLTVVADSHDLRPFQETRLAEAGLVVLVPARPEWVLSLTPLERNQRIELSTPPDYYPAASIQIVRDADLGIVDDELPGVALSALQVLRTRMHVADALAPEELREIDAGNLAGFEDNFSVQRGDAEYDLRNIVGKLPSGHLISILVSTPAGQMAHIDHMVEKILVNLEEV